MGCVVASPAGPADLSPGSLVRRSSEDRPGQEFRGELSAPAGDLEALIASIIGLIEVVAAYVDDRRGCDPTP